LADIPDGAIDRTAQPDKQKGKSGLAGDRGFRQGAFRHGRGAVHWCQRNAAAMNWSAAMTLSFAALLGSFAFARAAPSAALADLTIRVENVSPDGGTLRLGVYDEAHYPDNNSTPVASANVAAVAGATTISLHGIPPGIYAIETFQDVNSNGIMDTSWLGLPLEPFGFSRDARPFLAKPAFDDVKFTLAAGENAQVIHLQNSIANSPAEKARDAIRSRRRP
jgi:uncharacterized protein (DUF2141 family)